MQISQNFTDTPRKYRTGVGLNGGKGKQNICFISEDSGCKGHRSEAFSTNKIAVSVKHLQIISWLG